MTSKKKPKDSQASSSRPRRPSLPRQSWDVSPEGINIQLSEENVKTFSEKFWAFPVSWEWPNNSSSQSPKEEAKSSRNSTKSVSSLVRSALERRKKKTNQGSREVNLSQSVAVARARDESEDSSPPPLPKVRDGGSDASDFPGYFKEWRRWVRDSNGVAKDSDNARIPSECHGRRNNYGEKSQNDVRSPGQEHRVGTSSETTGPKQITLNSRDNSLDSDHENERGLSLSKETREGFKNVNTKPPEVLDPKEYNQTSRTTPTPDHKFKKEALLPTAHSSPEKMDSAKWQFSKPQFPSICRSAINAPRYPRRYVDCPTPIPDIQAKLPGIPSLQSKLPELKRNRSKYQTTLQADQKKREELPAIRRRDTDLPKIK